MFAKTIKTGFFFLSVVVLFLFILFIICNIVTSASRYIMLDILLHVHSGHVFNCYANKKKRI